VATDTDYRAGPLLAQDYGSTLQPMAPGQMGHGGYARDSGRALRLVGLIAVAVGLAALTAAACTLSYSSIHHLATDGGVSPRLARVYPFIFDALLVIAGCSVLALRGAGLGSRIYAWFCMLILLAALAAGGAVHGAAVHVSRQLAAIVAAVVPWALVLIGFGLLLALLRYARLRRLGQRQDKPGGRAAAEPQAQATARSPVVVMTNTAEPPRLHAPSEQTGAGTDPPQAPAGLPASASGTLATPEPATRLLPPVAAAEESAADSGDQAAPTQPRPTVVHAELHLRAGTARQAGEQTPADSEQAPLMPPVGPPPSSQQTNPRPVENQEPAEPITVDPGSDPAGEAGRPGTLNAAPVDEESEETPAFRRARSSPTPPGD
jgi:hypothetical protein